MNADRLYFVADFNIEPLARHYANTTRPGTEVVVAPFGPVMSALAAAPPGDGWYAVVWTRAEAISDAFARAAASGLTSEDEVVADVRDFAAALARFAAQTRALLVPTWTRPPFDRGRGMLDWRSGGMAQLLARMNLTLADALRDLPSAYLLDTGRWLESAGSRGWSQKLWYASKCPFTGATLDLAAADIAAAVDGVAGRARRIIVLDLDDVVWGGVVGEVGWTGLTLGGHDFVGEAFVDFQRALKALAARGVQLAVVSKNDEATAFEAIDRHPEMALRRADLAAWRINWNDKAQNVADVLAELNLSPDAAVFIDDSAAERARVAAALPGILVPEWPDDPARFREALAALRCFDSPAATAEDRARTTMFAAERARQSARSAATTLADWLQSLNIVASVEPLAPVNLERAAQLFNKTNQMNLSNRRLSATELAAWAAAPGHEILTVRVVDRFGEYGLTGIIGIQVDGDSARLSDFLLSCRVMGRQVEKAMLSVAIAHARAGHASVLRAEPVPTERNGPCRDFFERSGMTRVSEHAFEWDLATPFDEPAAVTVTDESGLAARTRS